MLIYDDIHAVARITPLVLWEFDFKEVPALKKMGADAVVRITNNATSINTNLTMSPSESDTGCTDFVWDYVGIDTVGVFSDLSGEYATPEVTIDRIRFEATTEWGSVEYYWKNNIGSLKDVPWTGAVVYRYITAKEYWYDSLSVPLYTPFFIDQTYYLQRYIVESVIERTKSKIVIKLTPSLALDADNILDRKLTSGYCPLRYRIPKSDGIVATGKVLAVDGGGAITSAVMISMGHSYDSGSYETTITSSAGTGGVLRFNPATSTAVIVTEGSGYLVNDTFTAVGPFHNVDLVEGGCPYSEIDYYKIDETTTTNFKEDYCGKTINDCLKRFDPNNAGNALPFHGTLRTGTKTTETN